MSSAKHMRVLLADDEQTSRLILDKHLTAAGFEVLETENGVQALDVLENGQASVDLMIIDIMMPEMDGLTLLEKVRARHPVLPVIMLTARDDRGSVKQALKLGASDYLDKPVRRSELLEAIQEAFEHPPQKLLRMSLETSSAVREVQSQLLEPSGFEECGTQDSLRFWFRPIADAGGDFFLCRKGEDCSQVLLADVAGHDVRSSYAVAELRGILDGVGRRFSGPADLLSALNAVFASREGAVDRFVCALCLFIDFERGGVRAANAGVPHLLLQKAGGRTVDVDINGVMLGVLPDGDFECAGIAMDSGDRLLGFTDGLEDFLGRDAVRRLWDECRPLELQSALDAFVEAADLARGKIPDDVLLMAVEQPEPSSRPDADATDKDLTFDWAFPLSPREMPGLRFRMRALFERMFPDSAPERLDEAESQIKSWILGAFEQAQRAPSPTTGGVRLAFSLEKREIELELRGVSEDPRPKADGAAPAAMSAPSPPFVRVEYFPEDDVFSAALRL